MAENTGFILEHCRKDCSRSAQDWSALYEQLEELLSNMNISAHLAKKFPKIHYHHLPKICIAGCPNGCSQPQIKDIGIAGYLIPKLTEVPCIGCQACVNSCHENALSWQEELVFDKEKCIGCGDCIRACQIGSIVPGESGWTLYLGGRLGRHPQLARISQEKLQNANAVEKIRQIIQDYLENSLPQERLTHFLDRRPHL